MKNMIDHLREESEGLLSNTENKLIEMLGHLQTVESEVKSMARRVSYFVENSDELDENSGLELPTDVQDSLNKYNEIRESI
jgi:hypothetical protein